MRSITFRDGATARVVEASGDVGGDDLLAGLELPPPRGTVVLNGSAAELDEGLAEQLAAVVGRPGLAGAAERERLTAVTGGTDAGIFSILGRAMIARSAPLVGVVPGKLVTWPGGPDSGGTRVPLEPHHSHFVLVDGDEWGDETEALLALARALGAQAPSVAVICGGGPITRKEVLGHMRDGRPVVVLSGSGRFADELVASVAGKGEIGGGGAITVWPLPWGAEALVAALLAALFGSTGRTAG